MAALPLEELRSYFGEELAFYFAFVNFYTRWLWAASVVGVLATIVGYSGISNENGWSNTVYSVFIAIWGALFLEFWKQHRKVCAWKWNMLDYEEEEIIRPAFVGEERIGAYSKGEFIPLRPDEIYGLHPPKPIKWTASSHTRRRMIAGLTIVLLLCVMVVIATISVMTFRVFVQHSKPGQNVTGFASVIGGIMNAVTILVLNKIYRYVAVKMNDWENHRTQSDYYNNLLIKIFLFQFVNSYTSMYYIAFFKRRSTLWGDENLKDSCNDVYDDTHPSLGWGCPNALFIQLLSILGTNVVVGQAQEVLVPWLTKKLSQYLLRRRVHKMDSEIPVYEKESDLNPYEGVLDEYSEMAIQYGYIVLFAASIPIAPLLAALNNTVEMRTDAFKLLVAYNKPFYRGADGIGGWFYVLQILSIVGVMTNCLLILFSFPALSNIKDASPYSSLWVVVILEHIILFIQYLVSALIPDVPKHIRAILAKQYYIQQQIYKKFESNMNESNENSAAFLKQGAAQEIEAKKKEM